MTDIEVSEVQNGIRVLFRSDNGGEASAIAVGMDKREAEESVESIAEAHNLRERAQENGQS